MQINAATLANVITSACAELDRQTAVAAEGEIGRVRGRRLVLRIEPAGADWPGPELPLATGAERSVSDLTLRLAADAGPNASTSHDAAAAGIDSPFNACQHRDACRALLSALRDILANTRYDLLPLERQLAERAVALAEGREP